MNKMIYVGLAKVKTKPLTLGANPAYGTQVTWEGHVRVKVAPKQVKTKLASGDDPDWMTLKGVVTGDVEIELHAISPTDLSSLLQCEAEQDGVTFGGGGGAKYVGIEIETTSVGETSSATHRLLIYKAEFDIPEFEHETVSEDNNSAANIVVKGKMSPIFYTQSGAKKALTLRVVNEESQYDLTYPAST